MKLFKWIRSLFQRDEVRFYYTGNGLYVFINEREYFFCSPSEGMKFYKYWNI